MYIIYSPVVYESRCISFCNHLLRQGVPAIVVTRGMNVRMTTESFTEILTQGQLLFLTKDGEEDSFTEFIEGLIEENNKTNYGNPYSIKIDLTAEALASYPELNELYFSWNRRVDPLIYPTADMRYKYYLEFYNFSHGIPYDESIFGDPKMELYSRLLALDEVMDANDSNNILAMSDIQMVFEKLQTHFKDKLIGDVSSKDIQDFVEGQFYEVLKKQVKVWANTPENMKLWLNYPKIYFSLQKNMAVLEESLGVFLPISVHAPWYVQGGEANTKQYIKENIELRDDSLEEALLSPSRPWLR